MMPWGFVVVFSEITEIKSLILSRNLERNETSRQGYLNP